MEVGKGNAALETGHPDSTPGYATLPGNFNRAVYQFFFVYSFYENVS